MKTSIKFTETKLVITNKNYNVRGKNKLCKHLS